MLREILVKIVIIFWVVPSRWNSIPAREKMPGPMDVKSPLPSRFWISGPFRLTKRGTGPRGCALRRPVYERPGLRVLSRFKPPLDLEPSRPPGPTQIDPEIGASRCETVNHGYVQKNWVGVSFFDPTVLRDQKRHGSALTPRKFYGRTGSEKITFQKSRPNPPMKTSSVGRLSTFPGTNLDEAFPICHRTLAMDGGSSGLQIVPGNLAWGMTPRKEGFSSSKVQRITTKDRNPLVPP
ncbi:hypothetical protein GWK47_053244 [Chionoecetes opilio]|uniref:Uncharacterized protein n=1 Tax=Chionoecetes opilio TaxID=41210 RepID=A0A8J4Y864_CHIOP|nr:hypothetical protein GWK47_053244 [Chionoecetes opilio]